MQPLSFNSNLVPQYQSTSFYLHFWQRIGRVENANHKLKLNHQQWHFRAIHHSFLRPQSTPRAFSMLRATGEMKNDSSPFSEMQFFTIRVTPMIQSCNSNYEIRLMKDEYQMWIFILQIENRNIPDTLHSHFHDPFVLLS